MNWKLIKQNKTFLSVVIILFIIFGLVIYFGGNQIYEGEAKWRHENAVSQLLSAKEVIKVFFSDLGHDLFFLKDLPSTKGYIDSDFGKRQGDVSFVLFKLIGKVSQVNNSVTFSGKPMGSERFLNRMVEALGIIIDRRPKGEPRKREN